LAGINGISQIFTGTHLPARCVPLGPHTAPLTPKVTLLGSKNKIKEVVERRKQSVFASAETNKTPHTQGLYSNVYWTVKIPLD